MNTVFVLRVFWTEKNNESCVHSEKKPSWKMIWQSWWLLNRECVTAKQNTLQSQGNYGAKNIIKLCILQRQQLMLWFSFFNLSHVDNQVCSQINLYIFSRFPVSVRRVGNLQSKKCCKIIGDHIIGPFRDLILCKSKLKILDSWLQENFCYLENEWQNEKNVRCWAYLSGVHHGFFDLILDPMMRLHTV